MEINVRRSLQQVGHDQEVGCHLMSHEQPHFVLRQGLRSQQGWMRYILLKTLILGRLLWQSPSTECGLFGLFPQPHLLSATKELLCLIASFL